MLKDMTFQWRLISSFSLMSVLIIFIGLVAWNGNSRLAKHIDTLANNNLPSIDGIWKVNEGQVTIEGLQRLILFDDLSDEERKAALVEIQNAWKEIDEALKKYYATPTDNEREAEAIKNFERAWESWKGYHQRFMQLEDEYNRMGFDNPAELQLKLISENKVNSPEMLAVKEAIRKQEKLRKLITSDGLKKAEETDAAIAEIIKATQDYAAEVRTLSEHDVKQTTLWISVGIVFVTFIAILLGIIISRQISGQVVKVVDVAEEISTGNLTTNVAADPGSKDEIGKLMMAFKNMITNLNSLIWKVQRSGLQVTTSSTQIAASGKQLEATVIEQLASTNQVTAAVKEISATSQVLLKTMEQVAEMSQATTLAASNSQKGLLRMETNMRQLTEATNAIAARLGVISENANSINNIVVTITKVADQTNLLSLNAAIEAEKAGEYGLGFAVVAREIRRLADQTAVATLDIEQMVKRMQSSVSSGVMEMDKFATEVGRSVEDVVTISAQITQIIEQIQDLSPQFELVSQSMENQSQGAQQISEAMSQLTNTSTQIADSLREINQAIAQLNQVAQGLHQETAYFKVKTENVASTSLSYQAS
jgi:methyl-accepting chemotaxis protein WspA